MKTKLEALFQSKSLTKAQAREAMALMMGEGVSPEQVAAALGALRAKKETLEEVAGFVAAIRERAIPVPCKRQDLMDNCGTGGDGAGTFNISTATSFVLAAGGLGVAKHGNRSVSSRCGSADVLEALGVAVDLAPSDAGRSIDAHGFAFLFSIKYHPGLARVGAVRRSIGVPTIFNILGPLVNPAPLVRQLVGVYDAKLAETMAYVLKDRGLVEAMVVTGEGGLDEITLHGPTAVAHLRGGRVERAVFSPEDAGLARAPLTALKGGRDAAESAKIIEGVFAGEKGPKRDVVCLNAAAGFLVCGRVSGLREGAELAASLLDSGAARAKLNAIRGFK
jgi:anthranilate phosphoribosyltransferase